MSSPEKDAVLDEIRNAVNVYWLAYFVGRDGQCSLCGNSGVVNTRDRAMNASGVDQGRIQFCFCPNGQEIRAITDSSNEVDVIKAVRASHTSAEFKRRFHHLIRKLPCSQSLGY
jgi:hypothetical protein